MRLKKGTCLARKLVAPSILAADFANLQKELDAIAAAGADWVHVDVMDGHFVNNITIGVPVVESLKKVSKLPLDVHLMIEKPERYVEQFIQAGASYLTIHVEATSDPLPVLEKIRSLGAKAGITLRPRTPISSVLPYLSKVDLVLVMTVEPGFGGQSFMMEQVNKIIDLKSLREKHNYKYLIEVDGGVNDKTAELCRDADVLVAGNYVFKGDYKTTIQRLKDA
jgi:ribulose-phosphate 3-epimerase